MRAHHSLAKDQDANTASLEAAKGAIWGATKWGLPFVALGILGSTISPIYRGLTIQFKVFIQMSGMTLGGYLEADRRFRRFEQQVRLQKRAEVDHAVWQRWEGILEDRDVLNSDGQNGLEKKKLDKPSSTGD